MASIQKTTAGGFRVSVCKMGVRDTKTFPPGTGKAEARHWGTTREAEIIAGAKQAKSKTGVTVKQLLGEWIKVQLPQRPNYVWELGRCNWLLKNLPFEGRALRMLELEDIEEWIVERCNVVSGSTCNRDLQLLGPIFAWGARKGWIDTNPIHLVKWPENSEPRNKRISEDDARTIIEALGYVDGTTPLTTRERLAWAFLFALETGMRRGEILKTVWRHVHVDHIHLPGAITKNRYKRDVPFTRRAKALVELLARERADAPILAGLSADTADQLFREARSKTPLVDLHFHDTRHEAVTRLARRLEVLDLAAMIGHRDINSLRVYYNPTPSEIAARLSLGEEPTSPEP